jgi:hypothetical protein
MDCGLLMTDDKLRMTDVGFGLRMSDGCVEPIYFNVHTNILCAFSLFAFLHPYMTERQAGLRLKKRLRINMMDKFCEMTKK